MGWRASYECFVDYKNSDDTGTIRTGISVKLLDISGSTVCMILLIS